MIAVTYRIQLKESAIFTSLAGDPNESVTFPYIPGSVIRGMVIGRYLRNGGNLDAAGNKQGLFFSTTRYLNAYPVMKDQRSLPVPATWSHPKYQTVSELKHPTREGHKPTFITDSAFTQDETGERRKAKSLSGFTVIQGNTGYIYQPETVINVHNARVRRMKPKDNEEDDAAPVQQVFRYQALTEGQVFEGTILCANMEDANEIRALLEQQDMLNIGGSRTAGYGSAILLEIEIEEEWSEVTHNTAETMVMSFLSDALLRDDNGSYVPTPTVLQSHLNRMGITCGVEPIGLKTTWIGGFNRKWGLPLPQAIGIERGSVVRLTGIDPSSDGLQKLMTDGIGDRREDGFGRVALGWQSEREEPLMYEKYEEKLTDESQGLSDEPVFELQETQDLWEIIETRLGTQPVDKYIGEIFRHDKYEVEGKSLSRTQISRLRNIIANQIRSPQEDEDVIATFLKKIKGKSAGKKFANARINKQAFDDWLGSPTFPTLDDGANNYTLQLIDAVLERAYRERAKQAQQEAKRDG